MTDRQLILNGRISVREMQWAHWKGLYRKTTNEELPANCHVSNPLYLLG